MSTDWLKAKKKWIEPARGGGGEQKTIAKPFWENRPRSIELSIAKRRKKREAEKMSSEAWDRKVEMVYSIAYVRQVQVIVYRVCSFQWPPSLRSAFRIPIPRKVTLQLAIPMSKTKTEYECGKLYAPTGILKTRGNFMIYATGSKEAW